MTVGQKHRTEELSCETGVVLSMVLGTHEHTPSPSWGMYTHVHACTYPNTPKGWPEVPAQHL